MTINIAIDDDICTISKSLANDYYFSRINNVVLFFYYNYMCCKKSLGLLVIRLGLGWLLLMAGVSKIMWAGPEMIGFIGWVAHQLGLTFLSQEVWFWLVAVSETVAGILFIWWLFLPLASLLTIIVLSVAFVSKGMDIKAGMIDIIFVTTALGLGIAGPGKYSIKTLCCKSSNKECSSGECSPKKETQEVVNV